MPPFSPARTDAANARPVPPARRFIQTALQERSAARLIAAFQEAIGAEGMVRHLLTVEGASGPELLACDYPFDPAAAREIGGARFAIIGGEGERFDVAMAGSARPLAAAAEARLHGLAMLYAMRLPALLAAGEAELGSPLLEAERETLARMLLGEAEVDIGAAMAVPIVIVRARADAAAAKLGAPDRRRAIVVAAQRGFLNAFKTGT